MGAGEGRLDKPGCVAQMRTKQGVGKRAHVGTAFVQGGACGWGARVPCVTTWVCQSTVCTGGAKCLHAGRAAELVRLSFYKVNPRPCIGPWPCLGPPRIPCRPPQAGPGGAPTPADVRAQDDALPQGLRAPVGAEHGGRPGARHRQARARQQGMTRTAPRMPKYLRVGVHPAGPWCQPASGA